MKTTKKMANSSIPSRKSNLTDAKIRATFQKLGIYHLHQTPYKSAVDFVKNFQRCTILRDANLTYTAHSGV